MLMMFKIQLSYRLGGTMSFRIVSLLVRVSMSASSCAVSWVVWNTPRGSNRRWRTRLVQLAVIAFEKLSLPLRTYAVNLLFLPNNSLVPYRVSTPPGKSWIFFFKIPGPGKSWKLKFKILESPGKISLKIMRH